MGATLLRVSTASARSRTITQHGHVRLLNTSLCKHAFASQVIKILLDAGADVNGRAIKGETPLHAAVRAKSQDCVGCLLDAGADVYIKNIEGHNASKVAEDLGTQNIRAMIAAKIAAPNLKKMTQSKT